MIDRICQVCGEYVNDVWVERIYDKDKSMEITGHEKCIDVLHRKVKAINALDKKNVDKVLKEIGFKKYI